MPIILQVTAWTILAVGLLALGHKFFPNFKQWFTTGNVSYVWVIAITLGLFVLLTYPYFFNWWAVNFWNVPESELSDFTKLGPLGDIYGSLNTLISSIALCAVAFSAWLQITSLKEVREANQRQESVTEYAIFSNQLYALLNYKNERIKALSLNNKDETITEFAVFRAYHFEFLRVLKNDWRGKCEELDYNDIQVMIRKISRKLNNGKAYYDLSNYFNIYTQILLLIDGSNLEIDKREFAINLVKSTMTLSEQVVMFFIAPYKGQLFDAIYGKEIFDTFYHEAYVPYAIQFYDETFFTSEKWKSQLSTDHEIETPA